MDYEKLHKETLERLQQRVREGKMTEEVAKYICPDFVAESEDERIRRAIGAAICGTTAETVLEANGAKLVDALAYLERQKEQKPNIGLIQCSWYMEGYHDGKYNNEPKWLIQTGEGGPRYEENPKYGTQKPAEWSEEDENALEYLDELIGFGYSEKFMDAQTAADLREWVNKSLRHSWKPSEEQMRAVFDASERNDKLGSILRNLYNDLKKL